MVLSNNIAALLGFACEAVLWGIYAVLFIASVVLLLRRVRTRSMNVPIFIANFLLFASCTAHFALELKHFYAALGTVGVEGFADETAELVGADLLISLSDFLGDLVLLYRCWVIWGKNFWVVLLPLLTAAAGFGCIVVVAHWILTLSPTSPVPPAAIVPLGTAGYVLPLATNVMATALIVTKLWLTARSAEQRIGTRMQGTARAAERAVAIIVESGVLYLATQLVFVVLFALGHPAQAILAVVAVQIYGIAPTLIVIRVALGISSDYTIPAKGGSGGDLSLNDDNISMMRPGFLPAIHSIGGTEESGRTTLHPDGESHEMKSFDVDFESCNGHAVAV
ncbi:hypothetical protein K466DRAFT_236142 [Polyporus arcularius HHB13444]|uniref:Family A G protein-coupled receptor-like protein n=1 Tax=Polyporus arcularius HHB13444 TaxID=1314778 RepID=A0A5C3PS52_9APHY|nr:hypothetical protein K466DRAFT_236142 [Polyporus arcularius HHB13444]